MSLPISGRTAKAEDVAKARGLHEWLGLRGHRAIIAPDPEVDLEGPLLRSAPEETPADAEGESICWNGVTRGFAWTSDPQIDVTSEEPVEFQKCVAQICISAEIFSCEHAACIENAERIRNAAPSCVWEAFREWAVISMACQNNFGYSDHGDGMRGRTHIARAVAGLCNVTRKCLRTLEGDDEAQTKYSVCCRFDETQDIVGIVDIVYWMTSVQYHNGIGPERFGRWGSEILPTRHSVAATQRSMDLINESGICRTHLWTLVGTSERKQADLAGIAEGISALNYPQDEESKTKHATCTPSRCQQAFLNTTSLPQKHVCGERCGRVPERDDGNDIVQLAIKTAQSTAWAIDEDSLLPTGSIIGEDTPYLALSHVWADGTGQGLHAKFKVNECLFKFFAGFATQLDCQGLWWDILSVPGSGPARAQALSVMHENYRNAKCTLVHDEDLLQHTFKQDDDEGYGKAALAIVLSSWFSRGWTALELAFSRKVYFLFSSGDGGHVMVDLDRILALQPEFLPRSHWLAVMNLQRLKDPVNDVGDALSVLLRRVTAYPRDLSLIASELMGAKTNTNSEIDITKDTLRFLGKVPYTSVLHDKSTMCDDGPFSWAPAVLQDMPCTGPADVESREAADLFGLLDIGQNGELRGEWRCRELDPEEHTTLQARGEDIAAITKVKIALAKPESCLLLRPPHMADEDPALLVQPLLVGERHLSCRYIGTVSEALSDNGLDMNPAWECHVMIEMGSETTKAADPINAAEAISEIEGTVISRDVDREEETEFDTVQDAEWECLPFPDELTEDDSIMEHVERAIIENRELALRVMITGEYPSLSVDEVRTLVTKLSSDDTAERERRLPGLLVLGDLLVEIESFAQAEVLYEEILPLWSDTETTDIFKLRFLHGQSRMQMYQPEPATDTARNQLQKILEECGNRPKQIMYQSRATTRYSYTTGPKQRKPSEHRKRSRAWKLLELSVATDLALSYLTDEQYAEAADTYKRTIKFFGPNLADQALSNHTVFDGAEDSPDDTIDDLLASEHLYERALVTFTRSGFFNEPGTFNIGRQHPLIPLTQLHLGTTYLRQSRLPDFEDSFRRSLKKRARRYLDIAKEVVERTLPDHTVLGTLQTWLAQLEI